MEVVRLDAGKDGNGNYRRAFVAIQDGEIRCAVEAGSAGPGVMPDEMRVEYTGTILKTTPAFYREIMRTHRRVVTSESPMRNAGIPQKEASNPLT